MTVSTGLPTSIIPTDIISATGTRMTVDGVDMEFQMTLGTAAAAEMNTYFRSARRCGWRRTPPTRCTT